MAQPVAGQRIESASDGCTGTIQWVDPVHCCMGVAWDDWTTSVEPTGEDRGWVLLLGKEGHGCGRSGCRCPGCGGRLVYSGAWGEHACERIGCQHARGPGAGGGWPLPWPGPGR